MREVLDKKNHVYSDNDFEYLIVIGGDGSFIHFAKEYANSNKKIIGIKKGFISFLSCEDHSFIENIENLNFFDLELLEIKYGLEKKYAINDLYISGELLLNLSLFINGCFFQNFRGLGLLFSTKLGSTALNKSSKGPILFPNVNAWIINWISSQSPKNFKSIENAMILSEEESVDVKVLTKYRLYVDGKSLDVQESDIKINLIKGTSKILFYSTKEYLNKLTTHF